VTVRRAPTGVLSLQINGKTEASSGPDLPTQLLAAHLPLLLHPAPEDALIIGLASGITLGAAERHPLQRLRAIEIARAVPGAARLFAEANHGALDDPRLTLVIDDARSQLLMRPDRYDVVSSQPSNPWVAGVANLFTVEFYRLVRARLRPHGVFCQWVQAYRIAPEDFRGIVGSFLEVFPDATLWEESAGGGDYFLVGGAVIDPARLAAADTAVWDDLSRAGLREPADLLARFVSGPRGLREFAAGARRHTDDNLYLEWRAPLALFRDTLHDQTAALRGHREAVLPYLLPGPAAEDPALAAALRRRLRDRDARLAAAESLQDADRLALREPHLAAGIDLLRAGRYGEAAAALSSAATMSPDSPEAHFLLGLAYRGAGLPQAAGIALAEAVRRDPKSAQAWNALGLCQQAEGRLDEAERSFEAALAAEPGLAVAHNNLGAIRIQTGDLSGAEQALRAGLSEDPLLAAALANLGLLFMRRGDPAAAEGWYRRALDLDPQNADARYNLARLMFEAGRRREAAGVLEEILRADPQDQDARRLLMAVRPAS
jgi:spermidine synthase